MSNQTPISETFLSNSFSDFENIKIYKIDASHLTFKYRTFTDCLFVDCNFTETQFINCSFFNCSFSDCNLSLASFIGSFLNIIQFTSSKLIGIDWTKAKYPDITAKKKKNSLTKPRKSLFTFDQCILDYTNFTGLSLDFITFKTCRLFESNFEEASLQYANFQESDLSGSIFKQTNLFKADLSKAKNYQINPQYNILKHAKFSMPEVLNLIYSLDIEIL